MQSKFDILIPVRNEQDNVEPLITRIDQALCSAKIPYHIYIVDDNSTDNTAKISKKLAKKFPITFSIKKGQQGKAYSILEAAQKSTAPILAMIDADLQYPPEVLPSMYAMMDKYGVVVARRQSADESWLRRKISHTFQFVFGKLLYGLQCDVQSGLKVFRREVIDPLAEEDVTAWTIDIPLLHHALELGHTIGEIDIHFGKRFSGQSKILLLRSIKEIG